MTAKEYLDTLSADEICFLGVELGVIDIEAIKQRLIFILNKCDDKILEGMGQDHE